MAEKSFAVKFLKLFGNLTHPRGWGSRIGENLLIQYLHAPLFAGTLPANKNLFAGTLPANKNLFAGTPQVGSIYIFDPRNGLYGQKK